MHHPSRLRRCLFVLAGLTLGLSAQAQVAGDTLSAACGTPLPRMLCVDLDGRPSVDPGAGPLTYRWDMGDGTILSGPVVKHCYPERKKYTVRLDVLVDGSTEVRRTEKIIPIDLVRQDIVDFVLPAMPARVGQPISFAAPEAQLPDCENLYFIWDFRDGTLAQGREVQHTFRRPGRYAVRFSIRANGPGSCPDSHCASREIVVEP